MSKAPATRCHDDAHADEGVDPYARPALGESYEKMIAAGRERYTSRLSSAAGGGAVVFRSEMSDGDRRLDKFRVDSDTSSGFTSAQRAAVEAMVDSVESGYVSTTMHVLVSHSNYDVRPLRFDLTCGQLALLAVIQVVGISSIYWATKAF
jgi:hypothetical protein